MSYSFYKIERSISACSSTTECTTPLKTLIMAVFGYGMVLRGDSNGTECWWVKSVLRRRSLKLAESNIKCDDKIS